MLKISRVPPDQMREAHRQELADQGGPRVVNLDHALALATGQTPPLFWNEQEFTVKLISYPDALELTRARLAIERWGQRPPETEDELDDCKADYVQTVTLFHTLLEPRPETNPFLDCSPREVGALLGFFSMCQMIQGASSRLTANSPAKSTR